MKSIRKVVIPAAGLGTRMLSATKEQPKEMLPLFAVGAERELCLKPLLQLVFEQLNGFGFKEFCFVVGREKRAITDHFTPDPAFLSKLVKMGKVQQAAGMRRFYGAINSSSISWVNQPQPLGFGHSLLMASSFVGTDDFIVHAGDTYVISARNAFLQRLIQAHREEGAEATLLLLKVPPTKGYGFAIVKGNGSRVSVTRVVEKPRRPPSNLAIMPIYAFSPTILEELRSVRPGIGGEIQLTDGIQRILDRGGKVRAIKLTPQDVRLDIGTPENYWDALRYTYGHYARIA